MSDPVRLTVVTGFLGAGKSTWLRHQLRSGVFDAARLVVNEAASTPVDHEIVSGNTSPIVLAGGCACCARRAELVELLGRLIRPGDSSAPPQRIVLETSGLADPSAIAAAVRDAPGLAAALVVSEVVTLVAAPQGSATLDRQSLARRQVEAADCLILTKLDRTDPATVARLATRLSRLAPDAPLFGANRGVEVPVPRETEGASADAPAPLPGGDASGPPRAVDVEVGDVEWSRFSLWLSALLNARGADVLRVKGVVLTPRGRLLLQGVEGVLDPPVVLPGQARPGDGTLAIIGHGLSAADLRRSLLAFSRACETPAAGLYSAKDGA